MICRSGSGRPKDLNKAIKYFKQIIENGAETKELAAAYFELADILDNEYSSPSSYPDSQSTFEFIMQAAHLGHPAAQHRSKCLNQMPKSCNGLAPKIVMYRCPS